MFHKLFSRCSVSLPTEETFSRLDHGAQRGNKAPESHTKELRLNLVWAKGESSGVLKRERDMLRFLKATGRVAGR